MDLKRQEASMNEAPQSLYKSWNCDDLYLFKTMSTYAFELGYLNVRASFHGDTLQKWANG